jgi:predicted nucleic acid-binding protein
MNGWLLDTNVLSELRRKKPSPAIVDFVSAQPLDSLFVSEVTFAEIRFGIELVSEPTRRAELRQWLDHRLRPMFTHRVLAVTEDILLQWRLIIETGRKAGHTFSHPDVLIAATAAQHGLAVVTRDPSDFIAAGVPAKNPWTTNVP